MTAAALVSLSLTFAASVAVFGVLDALFLKDLPVHRPRELVNLRERGRDHRSSRVSLAVFRELAADVTALSGIAAYAWDAVDSARPGEPASVVNALIVSDNYFDVLGVRAARGRLFSGDGRPAPDTSNEVVLSEQAWRTRHGSDPNIVGRPVTINRVPFIVVGVTPRGFYGTDRSRSFDLAVPVSAYHQIHPTARTNNFVTTSYWLHLIGRLPDTVALPAAESRLQELQRAIRETTAPSARTLPSHLSLPWELERANSTAPLTRTPLGRALVLLAAMTALSMLIACANVAVLQLSSTATRDSEFLTRLALGSSRSGVFWQVVTESAAPTSAAAVVGMVSGPVLGNALIPFLSTSSAPLHLDMRLDWRMAGFAVSALLATAVLTAAPSAWQTTRVGPAARLGSAGAIRGSRRLWLLYAVVVGQVGLTFALAFGTSLLVRTFDRLTTQPYGFRSSDILNITVDLTRTSMGPADRRVTAIALREKLKAVAGLEGAALVLSAPFGTASFLAEAGIGERDLPGEPGPPVQYNYVSPEYFELMGIPIVRGSAPVSASWPGGPIDAIVSETFARRLLSGDPLGQVFTLSEGQGRFRVAAVAGDIKVSALREPSPPLVYLPWDADTRALPLLRAVVRRTRGAGDAGRSVAMAVSELVPSAGVTVRPLDADIAGTVAVERALASLSGSFCLLALLLSTLGLFAALTLAVVYRTPEIAVRVAVGASPRQASRVVWEPVVKIALAGIGAGTVVSAWLAHRVEPLLYDVRARDTSHFLVACAVVCAVAALAGYVPSRRVARVDPAAALKSAG